MALVINKASIYVCLIENRMKLRYSIILMIAVISVSSCGTLYQKHTTTVKKSSRNHGYSYDSKENHKNISQIDLKTQRLSVHIKKDLKEVPISVSKKEEIANWPDTKLKVNILKVDSPEHPLSNSISPVEQRAYKLNSKANILTVSSILLLIFSFLGITIIAATILSQYALKIYDSVYLPQSMQLLGLAKVVNWVAKFLLITALIYLILALLFLAIVL